jgi:hypothetical protein
MKPFFFESWTGRREVILLSLLFKYKKNAAKKIIIATYDKGDGIIDIRLMIKAY